MTPAPPHPYIPHLDGLRALALAAVLLFHFQVRLFASGYLGVDVFFTLSGFLITSTIRHGLHHATPDAPFSLPAFFKRRFFRLYPAATVTALLSVLASYLVFPTNLAERVSLSAAAAQLFSANVYFHARDNYFDEDAVVKPLLHMWSLSLEEQFYLLWAPFFVLLVSRLPSLTRRLAVMAALAALSFAAAVALRPRFPSFVFFHLPARMFQFVAGALLSVYRGSPASEKEASPSSAPTWKTSLLCNAGSVLCVLALAASFTRLPEAAPAYALLPLTAATAGLIALPRWAAVSRVLALAPVRWVGRVSYAAYLVHWPLFVYARYVTQPFTEVQAVLLSPGCLAALTLVLAAVLHAAVESPLRRRGASSALGLVLVGMLVVATGCAAWIGVATGGFAFRPSSLKREQLFTARWLPECNPWVHITSGDSGLRGAGVQLGLSGVRPKKKRKREQAESGVLFFGNSYAGMWRWALAYIGRKRRVTFRIYQRNGCGLFAPSWYHAIPAHCRTAAAYMWEHILPAVPRGAFVGLSSSWYVQPADLPAAFADLVAGLRALGLRPFVLADTPGLAEGAQRFFACADLAWMPLAKVLFGGDGDGWARRCVPGLLEDGYAPFDGRVQGYILVRSLAIKHKVPLVDLFSHLCTPIEDDTRPEDVTCKVPGNLTYGVSDLGYARDRHHLSVFGSFSLASFLEGRLVDMRALSPR